MIIKKIVTMYLKKMFNCYATMCDKVISFFMIFNSTINRLKWSKYFEQNDKHRK